MSANPAARTPSPLRLLLLSGLFAIGWLVLGATSASAEPLPSPPALSAPATVADVSVRAAPNLSAKVTVATPPAARVAPPVRSTPRPLVRATTAGVARTGPALTPAGRAPRAGSQVVPPVASPLGEVAGMPPAVAVLTAAPPVLELPAVLATLTPVTALGPIYGLREGPFSVNLLTRTVSAAPSFSLPSSLAGGEDSALPAHHDWALSTQLRRDSNAIAGAAFPTAFAGGPEPSTQPGPHPVAPAPSTLPGTGQTSTSGKDRSLAGTLPRAAVTITGPASASLRADAWKLPDSVPLDPGSSPD